MAQYGLLDSETDARALSLQARLTKDRAKRVCRGAEQAKLFDRSAHLYARAAQIDGTSYPLINAASLSLFAGKPAQAQRLALDVLALIDGDPQEGETPYWREATRAEALLLLDRPVEARAALRTAMARQPYAWEDHAATIGQFELILAEMASDAGWLDAHRPPVSVHFSGIVGIAPDTSDVSSALAHYIASVRPGFAFGALAAGADLLFAEAFLTWRDAECPAAELHVILPYPVDQFRQVSVAAFGDRWTERFDAALAEASSTRVYGLDDPPLPLAVEYADWVAMGRTIRNAQVLRSRALGVTVSGEGEDLRPQLSAWRDGGRPLTVIEAARSTAPASGAAEPRQHLQAIVWWGEGDWSVDRDLLAAAARAAGHARAGEGEGKGAKVAILLAPWDADRPAPALLQRAAALAAVANPGTVASDEATALALIRAGWSGSVEEMGELLLASGREPIWSVFEP